MKKIISVLLTAAALLSCVTAPAAVPAVSDGFVIEASAATKTTDKSKTSSSSSTEKTTSGKLKAPTGITKKVTQDSIKLSWKAVKGADAYRVSKYDAKTKKFVKLTITTNTYMNIKGLKPGVNYKYQITALVKKNGKYAVQTPSDTISVTTAKLKAPSKISTKSTDSTVTFTWNKVEGASAYRVYRYDDAKKAYVSSVTSTSLTATSKNLKPSTKYKFKIATLVKKDGSYYVQKETKPFTVTTAASQGVKPHVSGYRGGSTYPAMKHDLAYMYKLNTDFIGWLTIADTPIDIPVVQATDNKFYLEHDFYGRYDSTKVGTTYADCHVPVTKNSRPDNLIIYGHNIRTGVGLAKITNYYPARYGSLKFYTTHPTITYESIYGGQSMYVVFAGMFVNTEQKHGDVFQYYKFRNFKNDSTFYQYFEAVFDRSVFYNPSLDIAPDDEFLTLSTCYYPMGAEIDTRFVLFARKVRKTDKVIDATKAYINPSPLYFDYYYKANGGKWAGRKWPESLMKGYTEWKAKNKKQS